MYGIKVTPETTPIILAQAQLIQVKLTAEDLEWMTPASEGDWYFIYKYVEKWGEYSFTTVNARHMIKLYTFAGLIDTQFVPIQRRKA